jgi:hypothetical protein
VLRPISQARSRTGGRSCAQLLTTRERLGADPFLPDLRVGARAACAATWDAETGRLNGTSPVEPWVRASNEWEQIERPIDASYCRWRVAQVALSAGEGLLAARLLRTAVRDARHHVPLSEAIQVTAQRSAPHPK